VSAHSIVRTVRDIAEREIASHPSSAIGVVTSIESKEGAYTCSVKMRPTDLVLPSVPITVGALGYAGMPQVGDLVLVVFAYGDYHYPVIVGRLYDDETKPPQFATGEMMLSLPQGPKDADKSLVVSLKADDKRMLTITLDGSKKVEVTIADEKVSLTAGDAKVELDGDGGKGTIEVGDATLELKKNGDVSLKAGNSLSIKATKIEIAADAQLKIQGQTIDLN
jgi:uncharacterized protein involved in type VI secretion and phage assembly